MPTIATLTLNPTIDVAYAVDQVRHTHKMRTQGEHYDPGGGGINVARVFDRLGGTAHAYYCGGGATGVALDGLLDEHGLTRTRIPVSGHTRVSASILEQASGKEYRFVPPGPTLNEAEWQASLMAMRAVDAPIIVASGSLPPGVPADYYVRLLAITRARRIPLVLDTSGPALSAALAHGGLWLVKPSRGELQAAVGTPLDGIAAIAAAASAIVARGGAELVAVTLGHDGALLASDAGTLHLPAIPIAAQSAVGAGDSFLAAMVHALASGWAVEDAFRYGIAAGAAAVLTPGTDLCHRADVDRLYEQSRMD